MSMAKPIIKTNISVRTTNPLGVKPSPLIRSVAIPVILHHAINRLNIRAPIRIRKVMEITLPDS